MFECTGLCPYTELCESFQTICRAESWMEQEQARMRRENTHDLQFGAGGFSIQSLQWRLKHMRRVKERCYSYNGRCLRFWQFKAREEEAFTPRRRDPAWPPSIFEKAVVEPVLEGSE